MKVTWGQHRAAEHTHTHTLHLSFHLTGKGTSGSGKSHHARRIPIAQPVSFAMIHMNKNRRKIGHKRKNERYFAGKGHMCWESS